MALRPTKGAPAVPTPAGLTAYKVTVHPHGITVTVLALTPGIACVMAVFATYDVKLSERLARQFCTVEVAA
jgi:hypothetical protein